MSKSRRLGPFLKKARLDAGLTQMEVSSRLGYETAQFVSEWERAVRSPPGYLFKKLCSIYKVSAEEFYNVLRDERLAQLQEELEKDRRNLAI